MGFYFDDDIGIAPEGNTNPDTTLMKVAEHYMELNPSGPVTFRAYSERGIQRAADYRYEADFNLFFPQANDEECVYAWAKMWSEGPGDLIFDLNCYGPLLLFLDGEEVWRSNIFTERNPEQCNRITLTLKAGWNHFVIRAKKTCGGFGWKFGSWIGKHPYVFMMPTPERDGQEGWLFSDPLPPVEMSLPQSGQSEAETGIIWNPCVDWSANASALGVFARIYGQECGKAALAWTKVGNEDDRAIDVELAGIHAGGVRVFCDGTEMIANRQSDAFNAGFSLTPGMHDLMVISIGNADGWGFDLVLNGPSGTLVPECPCDLQGSHATWLFAGPFDPDQLPDLVRIKDFYSIHQTLGGPGYWRIDTPDTYLRLYNENPLFGQWNYPLGVTLYGLLHAAKALRSDEIASYLRDHVQFCCSTYPYSKWDRDTFGGATHIHNLLSSIDSLDDCGSFGSCMLEVAKEGDIEGYEVIAHFVGDYIANQQDRFEDGTFYRRDMMHTFHNMTMWADDLYMSVPFLCRYYQLTGDRHYIDDAANQFFGFKKRLYMPEQRVMSHVYDLNREMATGVPWGRGNGWTLFSLTELLAVLPEDHESRAGLIEFFRELCAGILALQDEEGMWHQVLTHHDSYPETSCTSMFIYAFSRGIRFGWLEDSAVYTDAVSKAWNALNRISIDREGNVHGVCRGSEFSFTPDYYKHDLLWKLNDTHGMGIVLLAGVEVKKLNEYMAGVEKMLQEV